MQIETRLEALGLVLPEPLKIPGMRRLRRCEYMAAGLTSPGTAHRTRMGQSPGHWAKWGRMYHRSRPTRQRG